jgi:hypothetical protein
MPPPHSTVTHSPGKGKGKNATGYGELDATEKKFDAIHKEGEEARESWEVKRKEWEAEKKENSKMK